jgi:hypothetical protein
MGRASLGTGQLGRGATYGAGGGGIGIDGVEVEVTSNSAISMGWRMNSRRGTVVDEVAFGILLPPT